jgi:PAS domain S-box-containing protein
LYCLLIIITLLSACLVTAAQAKFDTLRTVTLQLPSHHQFRFAGYYTASNNGYFREKGLRVIIKDSSPSINSIESVSQGYAQYGVAGGELVFHRLQGKPVIALASIFQHSSTVFLCKKDSGITSPQDMIGRTILLSDDYDSTEYLAVLNSENIPLNRVKFVDADFNPMDFDTGAIDVISGKITNEPFLLKQQGISFTLVKPSTYGIDFYGDTLFTSEQEVRSHLEDVQAIREASLKGWKYAMEHPHEIVDLIQSKYHSPKSHDYLTFEANTLRKLINPDNIELGHMNPGRWQHMAKTYTKLGMVSRESSLDGFLFTIQDKYDFNLIPRLLITSLSLLIFSLSLFFYRVNHKLRHLVFERTHQLNASEKKFRLLTNSLPKTAVQGYNDRGEVIFWNKASEYLYGYSENQAIGRKLENLIVPETMKKHVTEALSHQPQSDIPIKSSDLVLLHKDDSPLHIQSSHVMLESKISGKEMYCIDTDLTSIQQAQEERKRSEERYRLLFETMLEGFALHKMIFDSLGNPIDYQFLAVNPAFEKITGYSAKEVVGRKVSQIFSLLDENLVKRYGRVVTTGIPAKFIDHNIEMNRYFQVTAFRPQKDHFACFFENITERKRAEDRIRYQASLLDHVRNGVYVTTNDGIIQYWNKYAEKIYQYSDAEAIGRPITELIIPQQSIKELQKGLQLRQKEDKSEGEILHKRKDGSLFSAYVAETSLKDEDANTIAVLGISIDMTEHNDLLKQLQQSQKMESIGTLAGGIAHDFNNILGAIIGYAEMAEDEIPDWTLGKDNIEEILKASNRAKDLVKQILAFSRKAEQQKTSMDLSAVLQEVLALLKASTPSSIKIIEQIDPSCGNIHGNPTQIHQVCVNLCTNAIQAMEKRDGVLTVKVEQKTLPDSSKVRSTGLTPGVYAVLSIQDNGCGIAESDINHIFDPYFTTKEVGKGSGLGLSVVHGIIGDHRGNIFVDSEHEKGTTFTVYFPEISKETITSPTLEAPLEKGSERILIVDDEKNIVRVTSRALERLGYSVTGITESVEALELFWEDPYQFDLVITDQTMPEISGDQLAHALHEIRPDLPVILCTGYNYLTDNERGQTTGIHACLTKPVSKKDLATAVRAALNSNS